MRTVARPMAVTKRKQCLNRAPILCTIVVSLSVSIGPRSVKPTGRFPVVCWVRTECVHDGLGPVGPAGRIGWDGLGWVETGCAATVGRLNVSVHTWPWGRGTVENWNWPCILPLPIAIVYCHCLLPLPIAIAYCHFYCHVLLSIYPIPLPTSYCHCSVSTTHCHCTFHITHCPFPKLNAYYTQLKLIITYYLLHITHYPISIAYL